MHHRVKLIPLTLVLLASLAIVQFSIGITNTAPRHQWVDPLSDVRGVLVERHLVVPDQNQLF